MGHAETDAQPISNNNSNNNINPTRKNSEAQQKYDNVLIFSEQDEKKFVERTDLLSGKFAYPRNGTDTGKVLIFNMEFARTDKYRRGSRRDVMEVITCFQRLGFNISLEDIFIDKRKDEIIASLNQVANSDLSEANCLILFFFTHGKENNFLQTIDYDVDVKQIYEIFANSKHLEGKPKMFIFQACKGDFATTTGVNDTVTSNSSKLIPLDTFTLNLPPDMILLFSTIEGNVSFRTMFGSWFIQELCKNFYAYGRRDDVVSLITRTIKCVSGNYYYHEESSDMYFKQMPLLISTLRKKFYLNTHKDRHILLKIFEDLEDMKNRISALETRK